ncbi:ROK family protein [Chitinibacter sp. SCUT-21]|uniref:polyphosphate--glucose phosphotransferase n=1 Tax=Chitinibacter sp. SCUT-21 TaxID=2970891 RepID=UPI0035A6E7F5
MDSSKGETDNIILGIDIGGTGIKGALVSTTSGELLSDRVRLDTPQPATAAAVGATINAISETLNWHGAVGCTFPAIVHNGITLSATNVDSSWLNAPAQTLLSEALQRPIYLCNDADAAGYAEVLFGAAKQRSGKILVITLGTGIGSALVVNQQLIPNTELGHVIFPTDSIAELYCAGKIIKENPDLSWDVYATRLNNYLLHLQLLLSPDLIIIGGGISKKAERFIPLMKNLRCDVVPAMLKNNAGIVGAAMYAHKQRNSTGSL